jgi:UDP-N-acetylmuramyl pentapeptide phosphotransferase/UDP-N-acetylglucosamine-1-phosphate transferase
MMNFLFKTGTYLFIWKKFKTQIISILASIVLIWLIFGIYDDLIKIFELEDTSTLLYLLLAKWLIVGFIILYNILLIKSIKKPSKDEIFENEGIILPKKSQEILDKKDILSSTDLILKKYLKNDL